jgi:CRISPR-associated protein Cmr2
MDWKLKLKAIFHDPPYKIKFIETHKDKAKELFEKILPYETFEDEKVNTADQIASAQSRMIVKLQFKDTQKEKDFEDASQVNYDECEFIDIFSENKEPVQTPDVDKVQNLFNKLGNLTFSNQDERAKFVFLFLWRFYPEIFPKINKHPADSRAPNHSIYDHLVQTSAIVSALPNPAFLLFTIGPVQSFISKARKTSDLWAGSYMLSYLIWESVKPLIEEFGPDIIIYPNLFGQPLVDRWLYFEIFKNSPFANFNEPKFREWFEKWQNFEQKKDNEGYLEQKLTIANLPNRFLAVIPYNKNLGQSCENAFKEKLKNLSEKVYEKVKDFSQNQNLKNDIEKHLSSYFQVYWVIMPWSNNPIPKPPLIKDFQNKEDYERACEEYKRKYVYPALEDYEVLFRKDDLYKTIERIVNHPYYKPANVGTAYSLLLELLEKLLGARKSVRDFEQVEQPGEKCHLCGEFEVLEVDWEKLVPKVVKQGERLCGVCLTKRLFPEIIKDEFGLSTEIKFPSTSEMASIGEKRRLEKKLKKEFADNIFKPLKDELARKKIFSISVPKLKNDPFYDVDGEFLMEETYRKENLKEKGIEIEESKIEEIKKFLKEKNINPSRYYAILQMDGDNMGKWLKGEFNPKIKDTIHEKVIDALIQFSEEKDRNELQKILCSKHPNSPSIHQAFSRKLSYFALEKVRKIVEDNHYGKLVYAGGDDVLALLPIEEVLKCAYDLQKKFKEILGRKASMSAGILVVHHKYPLYLALRKVNEAEKKAKSKYGKNGFCFIFMPHSGEEREFGGDWDLVDFMEDLVCKFKNDEISGVFSYQYLEVVEKLYEKEQNKNIEDLKEILKGELKRIFMRKEGDKEKLRDYLESEIFPRFEKLEVENFANMCVIAKKISVEMRV